MSEDGDPTAGAVDGQANDGDGAEADDHDAEDDPGATAGAGDATAVSAGDPTEHIEVEDLVERAGEHDDELAEDVAAVADAVEDLAERVERLEDDLDERDAEIEDLESRLKRKQADFQNYKKRREREEEKLRERATEDLVERLLDVRDDLDRALDDDHDGEAVRDGVEMTLDEFDRVLGAENVEPIDPAPGEEVDPGRHEVVATLDADQPEGTVADVYQPGYEMAEKVLRTAKVTVSDGE